MPLLDVEKAWAARASSGPIFGAPTFVGDELMLGAETEIATARLQSDLAKARVELLLSAFTHALVSDRSLRHLTRALEKRGEGDTLGASTHLALAGFWPSRQRMDSARRAFVCDALLKDGATPLEILAAIDFPPPSLAKFNPDVDDEPRIPKRTQRAGEWTRGGSTSAGEPGAASRPGATDEAPVSEESWSFSEKLSEATVRALLRFFTRSNVAFIAFDTLFVPDSGHSSVIEGEVQGRPDLQYKWDRPTAQVFFRAFINGRWVTLTVGVANPLDQVFRDKNGKPIARIVGGAGLIADLNALDRAQQALIGGDGNRPPANTSTKNDDRPKLCPDPTPENTQGRSSLTIRYREYVTGLPAGLDIKVGTVRFDGCRRSNGFLLEAKANYVRFLGRDGQWKTFFLNTGAAQLKKQLLRQSGAAALVGREVEWHVLQRPVADKLREIVRLLKIGNIEVIFDLGPWP